MCSLSLGIVNRQRRPFACPVERLSLPMRVTMREICPICYDEEGLFELSCGHSLCRVCALSADDAGFEACPLCRSPHLLNPQALAERRERYLSDYAAWRAGMAPGVIVGSVESITAPARPSTPHHMIGIMHVSSAGDLFLLDHATWAEEQAAKAEKTAGAKKAAGAQATLEEGEEASAVFSGVQKLSDDLKTLELQLREDVDAKLHAALSTLAVIDEE